jgi:Ras-related protein Rab-18
MIIGNKIDQESSRQVSTQEGQELAEQHQASFCETSATTAEGVKSALEDLVRQIFEKPLLMIQVNAASVPVGDAVTIQSSSGNGDSNSAARRGKSCAC